jgi:hypothetical protein
MHAGGNKAIVIELKNACQGLTIGYPGLFLHSSMCTICHIRLVMFYLNS